VTGSLSLVAVSFLCRNIVMGSYFFFSFNSISIWSFQNLLECFWIFWEFIFYFCDDPGNLQNCWDMNQHKARNECIGKSQCRWSMISMRGLVENLIWAIRKSDNTTSLRMGLSVGLKLLNKSSNVNLTVP